MSTTKKDVRTHAKKLVSALDPGLRSMESEALAHRLAGLVTDTKPDWVLAFVPSTEEPAFLSALPRERTLFVRMEEGGDLSLRQWTGSEEDLVPTALPGYREPGPRCPEMPLGALAGRRVLVLVPGRAFSPSGQRLGKGQGWYDRFLPRLDRAVGTPRPWKVGLAFSVQVLDKIPVSDHDVDVDLVLTGGMGWDRSKAPWSSLWSGPRT